MSEKRIERITPELILWWGPCSWYSAEYLGYLFKMNNREWVTAEELLSLPLPVPATDILWCVLRTEVVGEDVLMDFIAWCAEEANRVALPRSMDGCQALLLRGKERLLKMVRELEDLKGEEVEEAANLASYLGERLGVSAESQKERMLYLVRKEQKRGGRGDSGCTSVACGLGVLAPDCGLGL